MTDRKEIHVQSSGISDDAMLIIKESIHAVLPDVAVCRTLQERVFDKPITVFAVGKAAWRMAKAAFSVLGKDKVRQGIVITKYGHSNGEIGNLQIFEAGHPVPDENSVAATKQAINMASSLTESDAVVLLISGGGSALFECPVDGVTLEDIADVTQQLLACGADISEINCIRKRLSSVKGGRFAQMIEPATIFSVVLSDVLGDSLDVIASGPAHPDKGRCADAQQIVAKYSLGLSPTAALALQTETPKTLAAVETVIAGNVQHLCSAAAQAAQRLGYCTRIMNTTLSCEAHEAADIITQYAKRATPPCALIWGGETVVHVRGSGKGGRNQELALSAAAGISGMSNVCVFAVGSDGTDGPTDAAGGLVDGGFYEKVGAERIRRCLEDNDAYTLLSQHDALLFTGPTGTNVNDLYVLLVK